jgi:predicted AlkP superfamily pyrophosphatase or phosphodiesterase
MRLRALCLAWALFGFVWIDASNAAVRHVVVVSIDGGAPWVIAQSHMPAYQAMKAAGAWTDEARTTDPSITLPSHTSMLTGVGPAKHQILWNDWVPTNGVVKVPTVFEYAHDAGLRTAMFVGKEKLEHLRRTNTVDRFRAMRVLPITNGVYSEQVSSRLVIREATDWLVREKPELCFIHLGDPDAVGHKHGWGSREQIKVLSEVDAALGWLREAVERAGLSGETVIIITADHGGHARTHGSLRPEDVTVPWIAWGAGVKQGQIQGPVVTYDTAATALWLLGLPVPESMQGRPVKSAFQCN